MNIMGRDKFRKRLAQWLELVTETKEPIIIAGNHGVKHVVIEFEEYEMLREAIESKALKGEYNEP